MSLASADDTLAPAAARNASMKVPSGDESLGGNTEVVPFIVDVGVAAEGETSTSGAGELLQLVSRAMANPHTSVGHDANLGTAPSGLRIFSTIAWQVDRWWTVIQTRQLRMLSI
jgi:hypothetical protein